MLIDGLTYNRLDFVTSAVNDMYVGNWNVCLTMASMTYAIPKPFIYRGNPDVQAISPKNQSVFGGTRMIVSGTNLNSVAVPFVSALVTIIRPSPSNSTAPPSTTMTDTTPEVCSVDENISTQMICKMPNLNLPQDFIDKLMETVTSGDNTSSTQRKRRNTAFIQKSIHRKRREYSLTTILGPNNSFALVGIAFKFDAFDKYKNGTNIQVNLDVPGQISESEGFISFDPLSNPLLHIKGQQLLRVGSKADYNVMIGIGSCTVTSLTTNLLTCSPPVRPPLSGLNDTVYCSKPNTFAVLIQFSGANPYHYSCLVYVPNYINILIASISGGVTALVVIVLIIVVLCVACCRRYHERRKKDNSETALQNFNRAQVQNLSMQSMEVTDSENNYNTHIEGPSEEPSSRTLDAYPVSFVSGPQMSRFNLRGTPNRASLTKRYRYSANQMFDRLPDANLFAHENNTREGYEVDFTSFN